MPKFECLVVRESYTSLIVEVEARDADAAFEQVTRMDHDQLFADMGPGAIETRVEDVNQVLGA